MDVYHLCSSPANFFYTTILTENPAVDAAYLPSKICILYGQSLGYVCERLYAIHALKCSPDAVSYSLLKASG
jgi:hypothetical protein